MRAYAYTRELLWAGRRVHFNGFLRLFLFGFFNPATDCALLAERDFSREVVYSWVVGKIAGCGSQAVAWLK